MTTSGSDGAGSISPSAGKAVVVLELAGLAAVSITSHFVPLTLSFKTLAIGLPIGLFACGLVALSVDGRRHRIAPFPLKAVIRYAVGPLSLVVLALVAVGLVSDSVGNSSGCPAGISGSCYKLASWSIRDGKYYELYPFDAQGSSVEGAPSVQITASEYNEGAGADLRGAIDFGIVVAAFNYLVVLMMEMLAVTLADGPGGSSLRHGDAAHPNDAPASQP